jgi:hypothetical protein
MAGPSVRPSLWQGAFAATFGILLQLAFTSWGMILVGMASGPGDAVDEHAFCRARDGGSSGPASQTGQTPAVPAHKHGAFCCLWHQLLGAKPIANLISQPVAFGYVVPERREHSAFVAKPRYGSASARAPPILA